jgi:hypothetical protein
MQIASPEAYTDAIEKANKLRGRGYSAETCAELAALDASIQAYEQLSDTPGDTPAKPAYGALLKP